jgi:predicted amidohydrolase
VENLCWVAGVNRCGADPNHAYRGASRVVDPHGVVVTGAGEREGVLSAELDRSAMLAYRKGFPALADARADLLGG